MTVQPLPDFAQAGFHLQQACEEAQQQFQLINNLPIVQLQQIANQLTCCSRTHSSALRSFLAMEVLLKGPSCGCSDY